MKFDQILETEAVPKERIFSVSEFLDFLNEFLVLKRVIVQGEVGEKINKYQNYCFFNLLDKDGSLLKCFSWKKVIENLGIEIEPGMEIRVVGFPEIIKKRGELNFQVEKIELIGEGILKKQFEILKKKLEALGYFDPSIKKPIPKFCENIGLITSKVGRGALKDFLTHLGNFGFKIYFFETKVEGIFALEEIITAINWFNQNMPNLDVLVLIRGGGDWESLRPFNSEEIVKAIFASKIPIITGIGHEDDTTLADLAADLRASTPTATAKILTENWNFAKINLPKIESNFNSSLKRVFEIIKEKITLMENNLTIKIQREIFLKKKELVNFLKNLNLNFKNYLREFEFLERDFIKNYLKIEKLIKEEKKKIKEFFEALDEKKNQWQKRLERFLKQQEEKIFLGSPYLRLKQGYTITKDKSGKVIKDPSKLKVSQEILTKFYKGQAISKIKKIEE
jgi:exodeoxyribonuclease VII large subunit